MSWYSKSRATCQERSTYSLTVQLIEGVFLGRSSLRYDDRGNTFEDTFAFELVSLNTG